MAGEIDDTVGKAGKPNSTSSGYGPAKLSAKKLAAQKANAQKSKGPRTPKGKNITRRNALKHGLLARTVMFDRDGKPDAEFQLLVP